ncbi:protease modulator HflC [Acidovorax citrulli]|nr:protease modulator HflC [Paracidovorax citrulli]
MLALLSSALFVVDQRQFGVVYQLGQIKEVITEPGLNFKLPPPFQNVRYIDKRLLTLDSTDTESMLTAEKQRVVIDWYVRWRISDPSEYIRNVGLDENAGALQLNRVVRNAFQEEVNRRTVRGIAVHQARCAHVGREKEVLEVVKGTKPWGVDVVDVRITRVDYVEAITESVYRRMEAERKRVANELRSTGAAEGEKIRADADRQREITIANAYRDAQKLKGEGDAEAARIYADAFGRDAQFAQFYRSLEAYKSSFSKKSDVVVVDPSSTEFFKNFRGNAASPAPSQLSPFRSGGPAAPRRHLQPRRLARLCSIPLVRCETAAPAVPGRIAFLTDTPFPCPLGSCRITLPMSCLRRPGTSKNCVEGSSTPPGAMAMNWSCPRCWSTWNPCCPERGRRSTSRRSSWWISCPAAPSACVPT